MALGSAPSCVSYARTSEIDTHRSHYSPESPSGCSLEARHTAGGRDDASSILATPTIGSVAHQAERLRDMQEVAGSSPAVPTGGWYIGCAVVLQATVEGFNSLTSNQCPRVPLDEAARLSTG